MTNIDINQNTKEINNKIRTKFKSSSLIEAAIETDQSSEYFRNIIAAIEEDRAFLMKSKPRGICLIICNINYKNTKRFSQLPNNERDAECLHKLFTRLWFKTFVVNDLNNTEFSAVFEEMSKDKILELCDAIVVIFLGHGDAKSCMIATDGEPYSASTMMDFFSAEKCITLRKRSIPKLFIINACRGSKTNRILYTDNAEQTVAKSDYFEWRSTIEGYESSTNISPQPMTWFTRHLVEVFNEHAGKMDLSDLSDMVHSNMEKEIRQGSPYGQVPQFSKVASKKFHFLPGYYIEDIEDELNICFENLIENLREKFDEFN